MSEATLSFGYPDLCAEVGKYLGYGDVSTNWSALQLSEIDRCVQGGYRRFLHPPPVGGVPVDWSFLRLQGTLVTVAGTFAYNLPDNFGTFFGEMTYAFGQGWIALKEMNEGVIRDYQQRLQITSKPNIYAKVPLPFNGTTGQRWAVWLWPTPAQVYNFTYKFRPTQNKLTTLNPYPLGGEEHSETVMAACLAEAEWRMEDEHADAYQQFQEQLATAKVLDDQKKQQWFGYNGDDSVAPIFRSVYREAFVTINGQGAS